ncbi:MAG: DUF2141 domain-containing protein [Polymorphobacter sp.]
MTLKLLPLAILALLPLSPAQAAETITLEVVVTGLKTTTGTIRACVFTTPTAFPSCEKGVGVIKAEAPANAATVRFSVPGVPVGTPVAVSLFADVNDNKKMDRGMMGIPKEPIGISNNATNSFSAPDFNKAQFIAKGDMTVTIALRYY